MNKVSPPMHRMISQVIAVGLPSSLDALLACVCEDSGLSFESFDLGEEYLAVAKPGVRAIFLAGRMPGLNGRDLAELLPPSHSSLTVLVGSSHVDLLLPRPGLRQVGEFLKRSDMLRLLGLDA